MSTRRRLLQSALLPACAPASAQSAKGALIGEYDPSNIKLSHRMPIRTMTDEDLLFLRQIGIRWCRIEFGNEATFEFMKATRERLARVGMKIY